MNQDEKEVERLMFDLDPTILLLVGCRHDHVTTTVGYTASHTRRMLMDAIAYGRAHAEGKIEEELQ